MRHAELQEHYLASRAGRNHENNLRRAVLRSPGRERRCSLARVVPRGTRGTIIVSKSTLSSALRTPLTPPLHRDLNTSGCRAGGCSCALKIESDNARGEVDNPPLLSSPLPPLSLDLREIFIVKNLYDSPARFSPPPTPRGG